LTFDQATGSSTVNCSTLSGSDGKFIGSATVTSNQPVVASLMQVGTTFPVLMGYNGFTGGSDDVRAPLIMANNSGFYTGIQVQNAGSAQTTVTVDYSANTVASGKTLADDTFTLGIGESKTIIHNGPTPNNGGVNDFTDGLRYIGGATITSNNGQALVTIVNQFSAAGFGTAYEAFDASGATDSASAPLVMANNNTFYTGIQVQNVGTTSTNVTIDYQANTAGSFNPVDESFSLNPGESKTIIQNGPAASNGGANNWGTNKYIGSAAISATSGGSVVAIVNEFSQGFPGDQFYTYNAFNTQ
jgi:hypothetical protein